jgi:hypothetical protein
MQLPIDLSKAPFKPKYLDEETPMFAGWFVFGAYEDGTVGISDGQDDVLIRVPLAKAKRIIAAREQFVAAMLEEING